MAKNRPHPAGTLALASFVSGEIGSAETATIKSWNGPNGLELRRDFIVEEFRIHCCDGDREPAYAMMKQRFENLKKPTSNEATKPDFDMLRLRDILTDFDIFNSSRGIGTFLTVIEHQALEECILLINLLPLAWGLNDEEFGRVLGLSSWLHEWLAGNAEIDEVVRKRLLRLLSFQRTLQTVVRPKEYEKVWRIIWSADSLIGERSLLQAFADDGYSALDKVETLFWLYSKTHQ